MKVKLYLIRSEFGHLVIDDVKSIEEAVEKFQDEDYDEDDIEFDAFLDGIWELDDYYASEILEEEEQE